MRARYLKSQTKAGNENIDAHNPLPITCTEAQALLLDLDSHELVNRNEGIVSTAGPHKVSIVHINVYICQIESMHGHPPIKVSIISLSPT